jgi:chemotaxis protein MotA
MIGLVFFFLFARNVMGDIPVLVNFRRAALVLVGTIIGLINVLNHIGNSAQIGQGMATALLTTFYGLLFANFVFLPIAGKFAEHIRREALMLNVVFDGVVAACDQRPPLEIAHNLKSYADVDFSTPPTMPLGKGHRWNLWGDSTKQQEPAR